MRAPPFLLALLTAATVGGEEPAPLPSDLLQRVREAYLVLGAYRDGGEITVRSGAGGETPARYAFATELSASGDFRFELRPLGVGAAAGPVTWGRTATSRAAAGSSDAALPEELSARLGAAAAEALVVPALLALGSSALPDPEVLALDGEEPCDEATCWRLLASRADGALRLLLLVEPDTARLRRVEVEDARTPARASRLVVTLRSELALPRTELAASLAEADADPDDRPVFTERIEVAVASVAVRVLERGTGDPLRGLDIADFRLLVDGQEVPIQAVEWVSSSEPSADDETLAALAEAGIEPPATAKLVVFFVQADFTPSRMTGQMRTLPEAKRFLDTLGLEDQVAVVSFDSHLKLRQDFTRERERVRAAFDQAMLVGPEPRIRPRGEPSLARHFDFQAARDAAVPERGLAVTARALAPLPGEKIIVFVGWGLGRYGSGGVRMIPEYYDALAEIARANASVFALDVTDADYHSLEVGLKQIALDTGGEYFKTNYHPAAALGRLADLVAGFYRISFEPPAAAAGARIRIELRDRRLGELVAPQFKLGEVTPPPPGG